MQRWGIDEHYEPPVGGHVARDAQGRPTGTLTELWWSLNPAKFTPENTEAAVEAMALRLSGFGLTSLGDQFPSATALRVYQKLRREGRLPLRITFTVHCPNLTALRAFLRYGLETGFGDDWLKFGAVKFFVDGGITGAAGAFYEPYTHQPDNRGHLKLEQDELDAMVREVDAAGIQASVHVVGDRALDMLLAAFSRLPEPGRMRHRLEHAGHLCMTPRAHRPHTRTWASSRWSRCRSSPHLATTCTPTSASRADGAFALRRLLDAGLRVPGSSDSLGAQPESLNPFFGMWCAIARETFGGRRLAPEEAVSASEALTMYTTSAAWADWEEARRGTLAPGKLADLIVCGEDPLTMPASSLKKFAPQATILGGRVVSGNLSGVQHA